MASCWIEPFSQADFGAELVHFFGRKKPATSMCERFVIGPAGKNHNETVSPASEILPAYLTISLQVALTSLPPSPAFRPRPQLSTPFHRFSISSFTTLSLFFPTNLSGTTHLLRPLTLVSSKLTQSDSYPPRNSTRAGQRHGSTANLFSLPSSPSTSSHSPSRGPLRGADTGLVRRSIRHGPGSSRTASKGQTLPIAAALAHLCPPSASPTID